MSASFFFTLGTMNKSYQHQIQKKWLVANYLDGFGDQIGLHSGGAVNECIVSVSKWVLRGQNGPLLPEILHELAQGLCNVNCNDDCSLCTLLVWLSSITSMKTIGPSL